jgi:outer membrane lipoprotein SlyB
MALKLLYTVGTPMSFDGLDSEVLTLKGGEVLTLTSVVVGTDLAASDAADGYSNPNKRTVATKTLTSTSRNLMLADDGTTGYGTIFGTVVGGTVGQVTVGANLGPHTATASGKVSCWQAPGSVFGVTLDACDTNATTGLQPTNATLATGAALYATSAGLLTPTVGSAVSNFVVGRFIEFDTNRSLVTTPNRLVAALNSGASSTPAAVYTMCVFSWYPGV